MDVEGEQERGHEEEERRVAGGRTGLPGPRRWREGGRTDRPGEAEKVQKKNSGAEETGGKNRPASGKEKPGCGARGGGKIET